MKWILERKRNILAVAVVLAAMLPAAGAKGLDDFTLTKAIPADAFLAVHSRDHAGKEFINQQYTRVWAAVEKARFHVDLKRMFKKMQQQNQPPGAELERFDEQWQQITDLCTGVDWSSLGRREFALGLKLSFPFPELVVLLMPPQEKVKDSFDGLSGILKTLAELDPNAPLKLTTEEDGATVIHKLSCTGESPIPLGLTLARHNDVILVGLGPTMTEQALALLRGEGGQALAATARFTEAFQKLPPPTDKLTFIDIAKLMRQVRQVVGAASAMAEAGAPAEGEPGYDEYVQWKALPGKIIDTLDMWEYSAEVTTTDGMLATTDSITVLRPDAKSRALYPVLYGNKSLNDPLKYVPQTAGEFWATSGLDLPALYKAVVKIIREDVPEGEEMIANLEALTKGPGFDSQAVVELEEEGAEQQAPEEEGIEQPTVQAAGFDIEKDIVGWIGGSLISFSVPGPTPYSPSQFVVMLSVRDEAKAREMIDRLMGLIEPMMAQQQGSVVDAEIEGAEGFKSVVFPMLAMFGLNKPTIGVKDGWLFFGSSPEIIASSMKVAAGEAENFSKNERFLREGIPPAGSVTSLSFTDKTKMGEQLGQALTMVPMIGMMVPDVVKDPVAQSVLSMVGKLGRVVRKLDFFQSSASRTTFDGQVEIAKCITTYREPPVIKKPKPLTGPEEVESEETEETEETEEEGESKETGE